MLIKRELIFDNIAYKLLTLNLCLGNGSSNFWKFFFFFYFVKLY